MNDCTYLNVWQDEAVNEHGLETVAEELGQETVRPVTDVETIKALADPVRLAIVSAMMRGGPGSELRVMSVKELAAELGEPQTKLYRHIKQLEAVGLIKSVASRLVSGIVEHRYQACQADLILGPGFTEKEKSSDLAEATVAAAFEMYRRQFFAAQRAAELSDTAPGTSRHDMILTMRVAKLPAAGAADIRDRLKAIMDDLTEAETRAAANDGDADETVRINVLVSCFSPVGPTS